MPFKGLADVLVLRLTELGAPTMPLIPVGPDSAAVQPHGKQICFAQRYSAFGFLDTVGLLGYSLAEVGLDQDLGPDEAPADVLCLTYRLGTHRLRLDGPVRERLFLWIQQNVFIRRRWNRVNAWLRQSDQHGRILTLGLDWPRLGYGPKGNPLIPLAVWACQSLQPEPLPDNVMHIKRRLMARYRAAHPMAS